MADSDSDKGVRGVERVAHAEVRGRVEGRLRVRGIRVAGREAAGGTRAAIRVEERGYDFLEWRHVRGRSVCGLAEARSSPTRTRLDVYEGWFGGLVSIPERGEIEGLAVGAIGLVANPSLAMFAD